MSRRSGNLLLLFAGIIWGMGFVAQQSAMDNIGPMTFMALRFTLAAGAVAPFALLERRRDTTPPPFTRADLLRIVRLGFFFFIPMAMQQVGITATTVTSAGFLTGLYVVIVPIIILVWFREYQHWIIWPAALLATIGIYLLGDGGFESLTWGDWMILVGAFFAAVHLIMLGRTVQRLQRPVAIATIQFGVTAVLSLGGYLIFTAVSRTQEIEPKFDLGRIADTAVPILYAGLVAGGLAFTLMAVGQRYTREADAAILLSSEALFAALFGAIFLDEILTDKGYVGIGFMFSAIVGVQVVPRLIQRNATQ
ncbi:MAG: DMT family transporter [Acidimicrobiales bacterium]|jgi:drug/metabolite transporter (DMT)-like permease